MCAGHQGRSIGVEGPKDGLQEGIKGLQRLLRGCGLLGRGPIYALISVFSRSSLQWILLSPGLESLHSLSSWLGMRRGSKEAWSVHLGSLNSRLMCLLFLSGLRNQTTAEMQKYLHCICFQLPFHIAHPYIQMMA